MQIFEIIFPIFAIACIGYFIAYKRFLSPQDISGISRFVFQLAIPALLFTKLSKIELEETIDWRYLLSYYGTALLIYGIAMRIGKAKFGQTLREQGVFGMSSAFSNGVLVGLPIITGAFGERALLPLFTIIALHSAILFSVVTFFAEQDGKGEGFKWRMLLDTVKNSLRNPIIIGLILGLLANFLQLKIPMVIDEVITLISSTALPCALFVLGASLREYRLGGYFAEVLTIVGFKLVIMPSLVWILAHFVFNLEPLWVTVAVLLAGMPVGINPYMFAQKYQACVASVGAAVLLSSLLSIGSVSVLLFLFL